MAETDDIEEKRAQVDSPAARVLEDDGVETEARVALRRKQERSLLWKIDLLRKCRSLFCRKQLERSRPLEPLPGGGCLCRSRDGGRGGGEVSSGKTASPSSPARIRSLDPVRASWPDFSWHPR